MICRAFLAKIGVKYFPSSILRPYLKSPHQGDHFRLPMWKREWNFMFWLTLVFSKFYLLCANKQTKSFMGEKWRCSAIHMPWHGISSKNLKKVDHGAKSNALMVRSGQARSGVVRPGHAKLSGSENTYKLSACYTEAIYQISCQSGHRAQSNYCRYTNRLMVFKHFRYLPAHRHRYLQKFYSTRHSFWHTSRWRFTNDLCQISLISEEAKVC